MHEPLEHAKPALHASAQAPQFAASLENATHAPLHAMRPAPHVAPHCPALHTWVLVHFTPHAPQFAGSLAVFAPQLEPPVPVPCPVELPVGAPPWPVAPPESPQPGTASQSARPNSPVKPVHRVAARRSSSRRRPRPSTSSSRCALQLLGAPAQIQLPIRATCEPDRLPVLGIGVPEHMLVPVSFWMR